MQKEHFEQWNEFCKGYSKPLSELTDLNTRTFNDIYANNSAYINNVSQARRPEELISSQIKYLMDSSTTAADYWQEVLSMLKTASKNFTHQYGNYADEMLKKSKEAFSAAKNTATEKSGK